MSVITDVEKCGNDHRPGFLDIFRVAMGVFITYKGIHFITHMDELQLTTAGFTQWFAGAALAHYVIFAHLLGGPLLIFGLFTRVVSALQLPILMGAVFLINYPKGYLSLGQHMELWLSIVVLIGIIVFMVFGAGRFSIDAMRRKEMDQAIHH